MRNPFRRKTQPQAFDSAEMTRLLKYLPVPPPDRVIMHPPDMSALTEGIYPPIHFDVARIAAMMPPSSLPTTPPEPTDCVKAAWEDRQSMRGYHHNAYVSEWIGHSTAGVLVSAVEPGQTGPAGKPINVAVLHNLTGTQKATIAYLSIERAQQLVNQLSHAISVAEARTATT